ncbi:MAG: GGDEF domain-containing protein [Thermoguttaceae bacterium]
MTINFGNFIVPTAWALAVVAALGYAFYLIGQCRRNGRRDPQVLKLEQELRRAQSAASKLEAIVSATRVNLRKHQSLLKGFKHRVVQIKGEQGEEMWERLGREIEEILSPTVQLASEIASAHDVIRYESAMLMAFTHLQTDPLTGVCNRRGLDQVLSTQFASLRRYGTSFSLVIFDIDRFKDVNDQRGHLKGDEALRDVARLLKQEAREVDLIARYGGDEFVVLMPHTDLRGAAALAERVRQKIWQTMPLTISGGIATAQVDDTAVSLLTRSDRALYSAKAAGRNCVFCDDGAKAPALWTGDSGLAAAVAAVGPAAVSTFPVPAA